LQLQNAPENVACLPWYGAAARLPRRVVIAIVVAGCRHRFVGFECVSRDSVIA